MSDHVKLSNNAKVGAFGIITSVVGIVLSFFATGPGVALTIFGVSWIIVVTISEGTERLEQKIDKLKTYK